MSIIATIKRWLFGAAPAPQERTKPERRACARCGRVVAHTKAGKPFLHHCEAAR